MAAVFAWVGEKSWRAFLVAGIFLAIVVVTGQVYKTNLIVQNPQFLPFLLVAAMALLAVSVIIVLLETWFHGNGEPSPTRIDAEAVGVKITSPAWGSKLSVPICLTGTTEKYPGDDLQLWLFNKSTKDGQEAYWPQGQVAISTTNHWSFTYKPRFYKDNDPRELQLFLVGRDGQALIACYRHLNESFARDKTPWQGLLRLTTDTVPATRPIQIFLSKSSLIAIT